jgi:hypothetical protein
MDAAIETPFAAQASDLAVVSRSLAAPDFAIALDRAIDLADATGDDALVSVYLDGLPREALTHTAEDVLHLGRARIAWYEHRYGDAATDAALVRWDGPRYAAAQLLVGHTEAERGDATAAVAAYKRARLAGGTVETREALLGVAEAYTSLGEWDWAGTFAQSAWSGTPTSADELVWRARSGSTYTAGGAVLQLDAPGLAGTWFAPDADLWRAAPTAACHGEEARQAFLRFDALIPRLAAHMAAWTEDGDAYPELIDGEVSRFDVGLDARVRNAREVAPLLGQLAGLEAEIDGADADVRLVLERERDALRRWVGSEAVRELVRVADEVEEAVQTRQAIAEPDYGIDRRRLVTGTPPPPRPVDAFRGEFWPDETYGVRADAACRSTAWISGSGFLDAPGDARGQIR